MAQIAILQRKCTGCGLCQSNCPFGAIDMTEQGPELNAACKVCGICVKSCPQKAIVRLETKSVSVDKSGWNDILVFAEFSGNRLHPVSLELIGKARTLAKAVPGFKVRAVLVGNGVSACAEELRHYGVAEIAVYDDPALGTSGQTHMQPALRTISAAAAQAWCWWEQRRWDAALPPELPPASIQGSRRIAQSWN